MFLYVPIMVVWVASDVQCLRSFLNYNRRKNIVKGKLYISKDSMVRLRCVYVRAVWGDFAAFVISSDCNGLQKSSCTLIPANHLNMQYIQVIAWL